MCGFLMHFQNYTVRGESVERSSFADESNVPGSQLAIYADLDEDESKNALKGCIAEMPDLFSFNFVYSKNT